MSLIEEKDKEALKNSMNRIVDVSVDKVNDTFEKLQDSLMKWSEFEKKLSDRIDQEIIKSSSSDKNMVGGKCRMKNENAGIIVRCEIYYTDDSDNYQKKELNYRVPLYKFDKRDEATVKKLDELKRKVYVLNIDPPEKFRP